MTTPTAELPAGALHNMSAPPRTRITVRPLRQSTGPIEFPGRKRDTGATGMTPIALISLPRLIQHWFPRYLDRSAGNKGPAWRDQSRLKGPAASTRNLRLRCLVVLSRVAAGELKKPTRRSIFRLAAVPVEGLEEMYLERVRRIRPLDHDLPPFAFVRPVEESRRELPESETDPARALALLSRCSGTVYSAARSPLLPDYGRRQAPLRVFAFTHRTKGAR